jgi:hypothetical protein
VRAVLSFSHPTIPNLKHVRIWDWSRTSSIDQFNSDKYLGNCQYWYRLVWNCYRSIHQVQHRRPTCHSGPRGMSCWSNKVTYDQSC